MSLRRRAGWSLLLLALAATPAAAVCPGDLDGSGRVCFSDLLLVLGTFGQAGPRADGDTDADGDVDLVDLGNVLDAFGQVCPADHPNIVLILVDDVGVDLLAPYGVGGLPACTPSIDALAAGGLVFRNAWSNPVCGPTRAQILTGQHALRTGMGSNGRIATPPVTLPGLLRPAYRTAAVGKWHLAGPGAARHPVRAGYDSYAGALVNLDETCGGCDYFDWIRHDGSGESRVTDYATTVTTDDALAALNAMPPPWFLYVAYHAPHGPFHDPPADLCPGCPGGWCGPGPTSDADRVRATLEVLDSEIGRLVSGVRAADPAAVIFFASDNGTTARAVVPPHNPAHAKRTTYQGGIHVPLIVNGPGVVAGATDALVSTVDFAATIAELANLPVPVGDSLSFVPVLRDPAAPGRTFVYAERFVPNGVPGLEFEPTFFDRAVRNERYKLIHRSGTDPNIPSGEQLFDLLADPFETTDLCPCPPPPGPARTAYDALAAELDRLGTP